MCHDFQTEPYFSDRCDVECQHCQQKDDFCHCHTRCAGFSKDNALCLCSTQSCEHCTQQKDAGKELPTTSKKFDKEKVIRLAQSIQQKDAGSWEKDFDKWFGHREGKKLRFAYATGVFEEVKAFIREVETQARQQAFTEALEAAPGKEELTGDTMNPVEILRGGFNQGVDKYRANIEKRMK
jgi:hypothetical protein